MYAFEAAAAVPIRGTALQALRDKGQIHPLQKVLITAHPLAWVRLLCNLPEFGAEVTRRVQHAESRWRVDCADYVIDYKKEDFHQKREAYYLIIDTRQNHSVSGYKRALRSSGNICRAPDSHPISHVALCVMGSLASRTGLRIHIAFLADCTERIWSCSKSFLMRAKSTCNRWTIPVKRNCQSYAHFGVEHAR